MFFGKQQGRHTLDCRQAGVGRAAQQYVQAARDEVQFANESARPHMVTRILQIGQQAESTMSDVEEIGRQKSTKFSLESWARISTRNRSQRPVNHQLRRSNLEDIARLRPKVTHAQENTHSVRLCMNPPEALWPIHLMSLTFGSTWKRISSSMSASVATNESTETLIGEK